jgi:hypothetical protein
MHHPSVAVTTPVRPRCVGSFGLCLVFLVQADDIGMAERVPE